jgi:hypothetical protein
MIVDRYAPGDLFAPVPQLMDEFEPELRELDRLLDDDHLVGTVKAGMAHRAPRSVPDGDGRRAGRAVFLREGRGRPRAQLL